MQNILDQYQQKILINHIENEAIKLGFQQIGISNPDLEKHKNHLKNWIKNNHHGNMLYMEKHGEKRWKPELLVPGTCRIISVRIDYLPKSPNFGKNLTNKKNAYISRYALGKDYHKIIRKKLQTLANKISEKISSLGYRAFVDSAPVLEKAIAEQAGLGWIGKNTLLINKSAGSFFFLGELFINIPLPTSKKTSKNHCGTCNACIEKCPTKAIISPYQLDARKCISYLTIENKGSIPIKYRKAIGNRIFGCDDCQIVCPWNKFSSSTKEIKFETQEKWKNRSLVDLFAFSEANFLKYTEGSPIRRIGYESWLRNIAIGLGNAPKTLEIMLALKNRLNDPSPIVKEHTLWAYQNQLDNT